MTPPPARPKVYHITHVDNLAGIVAEGALLSKDESTKPSRTRR